jgi:predicted SAM-dependent methyltransferase
MKALNLACGRSTKQSTEEIEWINVDSYERENKLDVICDLTKEFPFEKDSYEYIYCEHFIEHLDWFQGILFLNNCYNCLKEGGILRLVLPHYRKVFQKYVDNDFKFFEPLFVALNENDLPYYREAYLKPEELREKRKDNPPPDWHLSPRQKDHERVKLRTRIYKYPIEIVNYFTHQYGEHKTLYDYEMLRGLLSNLRFNKVYTTNRKEIDMDAPTRNNFSLYIEAIK